MNNMESTTIDIYSEYGSIWHWSTLIRLLGSSHKDDGVDLYSWMFQ